MPLSRRPFPFMLLLVALLLTLSVTSVPALLGQEATAEVTEEPATSTPAPLPTDEATPLPTDVPATPVPEQTETVTPENTEAPTEAPTAIPTEAPTEAPTEVAAQYSVEFICTELGSVFVITNNGPDMADFDFYYLSTDVPPVIVPVETTEPIDEPDAEPALEPVVDPVLADDVAGPEQDVDAAAEEAPIEIPDDEPVVEPAPEAEGTPFLLLAGESLTVDAGYGAPSLRLGEEVYESEGSCALPAPVVSVSAVCVFETGTEFTIINQGGPMKAEQAYAIASAGAEPVEGAFLLAANQQFVINAGYGLPAFTSGELTSALDEFCYAPAEIQGVLWNDANNDGVRDEGEAGLAGVTVNVIDPAGFALAVVSAADGSYSFGQLPIAIYTVQVDTTTLPSPDFALTYPADADAAAVTIDIQISDTYSADFGFHGTPTASVSGVVWLETGNFGVFDAGELGVPNVLVELVDHTGTVIAISAVDGVSGAFSFSDLLAGEYIVRLAQETLFTPHGITWNSDANFDYETPIILATDQMLTDVNFGVVGTF